MLLLDWTLAIAITLAAMHLLGPRIHHFLQAKETIAISLGGGMAVAYVFLQLIPEVEQTHAFIGDAIHFFILIGFIIFYSIERYLLLLRLKSPTDSNSDFIFHLHLALAWIYNWLIIFTMPEQIETSAFHAVISTVAISLHLLYKDYILQVSHARAFNIWGRYVLASAPLIGWAMETYMGPTKMISDIAIAMLSGYVLYNVFNDELPNIEKSSFLLFISGIGIYLTLSVLS